MRALLSVICDVRQPRSAALAQSYSASGQVGYLQEWELKASLAKTVTGGKVEYSGPLTLRHVGLCSANGAEEKSGDVAAFGFAVDLGRRGNAGHGRRQLPHRRLRNRASYSGLLSCRNAQGVPISFSIDQASAAVARGPDAGK